MKSFIQLTALNYKYYQKSYRNLQEERFETKYFFNWFVCFII